MRKPLLIGLIVCLVAIGGIGAAFATGLGFGNSVGALSTGTAVVPQANVDGVVWGVESDPTVSAYYVKLSFDRDLVSGAEVGVDVLASDNTVLSHFWGVVGPLANAAYTKITFASPIPVANIYGIRVTVSEET